jgi:epoxyqueuosine reductase QueG
MRDVLNRWLPLWGVCAMSGDELLPYAKLPAGTKSIICAAFPYRLAEKYYSGRNIARFAVVRDYHEICGARLENACAELRAIYPGEEFVRYCDNTPLPEVRLAVRAGLGVQGYHNLLITKSYGSWVFLGDIATTATLPALRNCEPPQVDCAACGACRKACPTAALRPEGFVRTQCVSHITQKKGTLMPEETKAMQRTQSCFGCDVCQEVCPANRDRVINPLPEFLIGPRPRFAGESPLEGWTYAWRGRETLTRNLENM